MKWKRWTLAVGVILVAAVAAYWVARTPDYERLKLQGGSLVSEINGYRASHGDYPRSFEDAHIKSPLTCFGHWHYRQDAAQSFCLWLGDYGRDGFTLRFCQPGGWYLDS